MMKRTFSTGALIVALFATCGWACSRQEVDQQPPAGNSELPADTPGIPDKALSYLALGDSYTIGTGVPESDRFPVQLKQRLIGDGFDLPVLKIIATNGWTTGNLLAATNNFTPDSAYSLVTLLIGVNNQFQGRPIEEYADQFTQLLIRAIGYAGNDTSRVCVISIPDYSVTPFGQSMNPALIAQQIDDFNEINNAISTNYGVSYFYITDISREAGNNSSLLAPDNLHPSGVQYALWIESFYEQVKKKLYE